MPVVDGLPIPIATGQIPPRAASPAPPEHPVDHHPVIRPAPTPRRRAIRQQRLQPGPFLISQIMTIKHTDDLPDPHQEIHGTRPSLRPWTDGRRGRVGTIRGRLVSSSPGSPPTPTAWTTWSGCAGRTASSAPAASMRAAGRSVTAATSARAVEGTVNFAICVAGMIDGLLL